ncbi:MAG: GDSL-type esterase/lipase family protein [Ferruginibacter sp.]|nr:SGNH/GDSL hydrolase family protein [Ferruginibacter sp.]
MNYLALGDSYTIGEGVMLSESYPYQTVQLLRKKNIKIAAPEIIAKTGWTTDELDTAISKTTFLPSYDIVTLLIGVNNQYRGRSVKEFETEFSHLLQLAIKFANNNSNHVFVLSIPDWGVTPFAATSNANDIATEIKMYNEVCKTITSQFNCYFIDITTEQILNGNKEAYLAADGLHPSGLEYINWAKKLADTIESNIG